MSNSVKAILAGAGILSIAVVLGVAAVVINNNQTVNNDPNLNKKTEVVVDSNKTMQEDKIITDSKTKQEDISESNSGETKIYKVGDVVKLDGYSVKVISFEDPFDSSDGEPIGGLKYIAVEVEYENNGSKTLNYSSYGWSIVEGFSEGVDSNYEKIGKKEPSIETGNGKLAINSKVKGWITFRIGKSMQKYTLRFTPFGESVKPVEFELK